MHSGSIELALHPFSKDLTLIRRVCTISLIDGRGRSFTSFEVAWSAKMSRGYSSSFTSLPVYKLVHVLLNMTPKSQWWVIKAGLTYLVFGQDIQLHDLKQLYSAII